MAILKVSRLGHPVLRKPSTAVSKEQIASPEIQRLIDDMIDTMREYDGVGIAAPQVHVSQQIAVIEVEHNRRYPGQEAIPLTVLINPKILNASKKQEEDWVWCLSVNEFRGKLPRVDSLEAQAYNQTGWKLKVQ